MRRMARWAGVALGGLVVVTGCGPDSRMDEVLEQLRSLQRARADSETLRGEVSDAFAPLREALAGMSLDQAEVRTRFADVSREMGEVLGAVKGSVDAEARARLEQLQARLLQLESEMRQRAEAAREEQDLILRALEVTAEKLDGFLRRVQALGAPGTGAERSETGTPPGPTENPTESQPANQSGRGNEKEGDQASTGPGALGVEWWWGVGGLLLALAIAAGAGRRRSRGPSWDDHSVEPVDPPAPEPAEAPAEPTPHALWLEHPRPSAAAEVARRWLADDPRVLARPEPEVAPDGDRLALSYRLAPDLPPGEAARVAADVAGALR